MHPRPPLRTSSIARAVISRSNVLHHFFSIPTCRLLTFPCSDRASIGGDHHGLSLFVHVGTTIPHRSWARGPMTRRPSRRPPRAPQADVFSQVSRVAVRFSSLFCESRDSLFFENPLRIAHALLRLNTSKAGTPLVDLCWSTRRSQSPCWQSTFGRREIGNAEQRRRAEWADQADPARGLL